MSTKCVKHKSVYERGTRRRVEDAKFEKVSDPRQQGKVKHTLLSILNLLLLGALANVTSIREFEKKSETMSESAAGWAGISGRIADNTISAVVRQLAWLELRWALHRTIKAEWNRKNLRNERLLRSTASVDGKCVAILRRFALVAATTLVSGIIEPTDEEIEKVFESAFPEVQIVHHDSGLFGKMMVHRTTLVSSEAATCIDQWPVPGNTNEMGTIVTTLRELLLVYGKSKMIELMTMDAGNSCRDAAAFLVSKNVDYFMAIKTPQGEIHKEAERLLGGDDCIPTFGMDEESRSGRSVLYDVYVTSIPVGHMGWSDARTLVRIRRVTIGAEDDDTTEGNRYYVTSLSRKQITPKECAAISRHHWRCENENHWTSDAIHKEDIRQNRWSRHPHAILVFNFIDMIALNIQALHRSLTATIRNKLGKLVKATWKATGQYFLQLIFPINPAATKYERFNLV